MTESSMVSIAQMCGSLKNLTTLMIDVSDWKCVSDTGLEEMKN
jgi:hypothetical protein